MMRHIFFSFVGTVVLSCAWLLLKIHLSVPKLRPSPPSPNGTQRIVAG